MLKTLIGTVAICILSCSAQAACTSYGAPPAGANLTEGVVEGIATQFPLNQVVIKFAKGLVDDKMASCFILAKRSPAGTSLDSPVPKVFLRSLTTALTLGYNVGMTTDIGMYNIEVSK